MYGMPTFTIKNQPKTGKYIIHGCYGWGLTLAVTTEQIRPENIGTCLHSLQNVHNELPMFLQGRPTTSWKQDEILGGWFQIFVYFHLYLGKIPNLPNIFQMDWNHQPEYCFLVPDTSMPFGDELLPFGEQEYIHFFLMGEDSAPPSLFFGVRVIMFTLHNYLIVFQSYTLWGSVSGTSKYISLRRFPTALKKGFPNASSGLGLRVFGGFFSKSKLQG